MVPRTTRATRTDTLVPYTTLLRSEEVGAAGQGDAERQVGGAQREREGEHAGSDENARSCRVAPPEVQETPDAEHREQGHAVGRDAEAEGKRQHHGEDQHDDDSE